MNDKKTTWNIIEDLKTFEKKYFIINKNNNDDFQNYILYYYDWLKKKEYSDLYIKVLLIIEKINNKSIEKKINLIINEMKTLNVDFKIFNIIKNEHEIFDALMAHIITKNLITYSFMPHLDDNYIDNENRPSFQTFDDLVNKMKEQLDKIIIWLEIILKKKINWYEKNSRHYFVISLYSMLNNGILKKKILWHINKKYIFIQSNKEYPELTYQLEIYYNPFNIYKNENNIFYQYNIHFSSISKILKENPKSGKSFYWSDLENFLKKQVEQSWLFIHTERIEETIELLLKEYEIKKESIEIDYNTLITMLKKAIEISDLNTIKALSKKIPLYQSIRRLMELKSISNMKRKIYIPFFKDFRGRRYDTSTLTLTFFKELRYVTHRGYYSHKEIYLDHNLIFIIDQILEKYTYHIDNWAWLNFSHFDIKIKRELIWILIAAAEHMKTELGKEIQIEKFIIEGKKQIENFHSNILNIDEKLKISYLIYILKDIHNGSSIKWLIPKDATASGIQHLVKTVGNDNENVLKWCNLKSNDTWYDTYAIIIEKFINSIEYRHITKKDITELFNRKTLKQTIMTQNYGASIITCQKYFNEKINLKKYSNTQCQEIEKIFKLFYEYISNNPKLLKYSPLEINKYILKQKNYQIELNDGSIINHSYFKQETKQIEFRLNGLRLTRQELFNTNKFDNKKMSRAMIANYIQALDAILIRWYLYHNWAITIHDCFLIDYRNISFLIAKLNEGMSLIFHDLGLDIHLDTSKLFSIFILL